MWELDLNTFNLGHSLVPETLLRTLACLLSLATLFDSYTFDESITAKVDDGKVIVTRANETKQVKSLHGTTNALIANMFLLPI